MFKKIVIAFDHRVNLKYVEKIKQILGEKQIAFEILDTDHNPANDYPLLTNAAVDLFHKSKADGMILLCGSGVGMCMVANKFDGIRAFVAHSEQEVYFARSHENSNCITFGAGVNDEIMEIKPLCRRKMARMLEMFLSTEFAGERHERRLNQIADIEKVN